MRLILLGLNHRTAPARLRERLALAEDEAAGLLTTLCGQEGVAEAVALSTCNRTEIYLEARAGCSTQSALRHAFERAGIDAELFFTDHALHLSGHHAVRFIERKASMCCKGEFAELEVDFIGVFAGNVRFGDEFFVGGPFALDCRDERTFYSGLAFYLEIVHQR